MKPALSSAFPVAALALGLAGAPPASACDLDGLFGHGFPPSFGMGRSLQSRGGASPGAPPPDFAPRYILQRPAVPVAPPVAPPVDTRTLERIGPRLRALHKLLEGLPASYGQVSVAVLSLDSGRWTRFTRTGHVVQVMADAEKSEPGDVVIRAGDSTLGEVLDRRLPLPAAVESGLVLIDSATAAADAARRMLVLMLA